MNNMDNQKSMDLGAVKEQIRATHEGLGQIRSMEYAKNLTANNFRRHHSCRRRIVVALKACLQSIKGIFMPESLIRGQQYVTEVIAVGDVKLVERRRSVNVFWTSRNNTGHTKSSLKETF
jgi:hypothetical protein